MPSQRTSRTISLEEAAGELRQKLRSAVFWPTQATSRGTVCRAILAFGSCAVAAAFGGVALAAGKTALSLLAAKWPVQVDTPATVEWESAAAGIDTCGTCGPGCDREGNMEHTAPVNRGLAFALMHSTEVTHAEPIQISNTQIK